VVEHPRHRREPGRIGEIDQHLAADTGDAGQLDPLDAHVHPAGAQLPGVHLDQQGGQAHADDAVAFLLVASLLSWVGRPYRHGTTIERAPALDSRPRKE
jgi:hypothetical protein